MALRTLPNAVVGPGVSARADVLTMADLARLKRYQEYLDWYSGKHWTKERRGRTNLTLNYCRAIVDKGASYLLGRGVGFAVDAGEAGTGAGRRGEWEQDECGGGGGADLSGVRG